MRGNLLGSYYALAKADWYLERERSERNERKVEELSEKIHYVQREIYNLGGKE